MRLTILIAVNMNYTCVIVGGLLFLFTGWWFVVRKPYTARMLRARDENEALVAAGARG
jgi:choline transport protein